jgi:hypothetical protein
LHADAVLQTADQIEIVIAAVQSVGRVECERQPHLGTVVHNVGRRRHDAEHFAAASVELDGLTDDWPSAERPLPQLVREDDDGRRRQLLIGGLTRCGRRCGDIGLAGTEKPSLCGRHTQRLEQVLVHRSGADSQRPIARS